MTHLQSLIKNSQKQMDKLRMKSIGIFHMLGVPHLVLEYNSVTGLIHALNITNLGAIQETYVNESMGKYKAIPIEYKSLHALMQFPLIYNNWYYDENENVP